jgi:carbon monoxide dehydrogenase subunit G
MGGEMAQFRTTRTIKAPVDLVFSMISEINNFSKAIPHITNIEFLSEVKSGVGTRFRETRLMGGKEATTELELTEHKENELVRFVADSNGTIWDTIMTIQELSGTTKLEMKMDAKSYKLMSKIMTYLIQGMVQKALEADMDSLKQYCEDMTSSG